MLLQVSIRAGFAGPQLPRVCDRPRQPNEAACPMDPYQIMPEKCQYVDQQTWKLQVLGWHICFSANAFPSTITSAITTTPTTYVTTVSVSAITCEHSAGEPRNGANW